MKCPHCLVEFHSQRKIIGLGSDSDGKWAIERYICPNPGCQKIIAYLLLCEYTTYVGEYAIATSPTDGKDLIFNKILIKPKGSGRAPVPKEVPINIATDYTEACITLPDSTKASAALSRRCLQNLLRLSAGIKDGNLANEIQQVLDSNKLPSHIADSIDAIRNIGNYAAHPAKSISTGEIVEVEPGEAEWNLEVLEMLFDFYYVQPEKTKLRRAALNAKLNDTGKNDMK